MADAPLHEGLYESLQQAARARCRMTYGMLAPLLGLDLERTADRNRLSRLLGDISRHEHAQQRPLLSVLVFQRVSGLPGVGFFRLARELGRLAGPDTAEARRAFAAEELAEVYDLWGF